MEYKNSLNILSIASWYPSRVHPTLGNFVQRHTQAIATQHNVTLIYLAKDVQLKSDFEIEINSKEGVKEVICYYRKKGILGSGYVNAFKHVLTEKFDNSIASFDLVHVHVLFRAGWLAYRLKKKYTLPYIITEHWTGYHNKNQGIGMIQRLASKTIAKNSSCIVPVSEHLAESMDNYGLKASYSVIPNVVNHHLFKPTDEKHDQFTFIHVSSLVDDHKNVTGIIRAFKNTYENIPSNLEVVGDGDIQPYIEIARSMGIPDHRVSFSGAQPLTEISKRMAKAHCLILFSNYENQPCVIPEAHSCGLPVIATNVGGIKEHLSEKHGVLIQKGNESELQKAMIYVFENHEKYSQDWLRNYVIDRFSVEAIANSYTRIYNNIS